MADPICRWRNSSAKQLLEFNALIPFHVLPIKQAREIIENRWICFGYHDFFSAPYQLAVQMGLYYEDNDYFYPRFEKPLVFEEAIEYMSRWAKLYYAPNPYTPSMNTTSCPIIINNFLVNWCFDHENPLFDEALAAMFSENIGNYDILVNMLNNFSEVLIQDNHLTLKETAPKERYDTVEVLVEKNDRQAFFNHFMPCYTPSYIRLKKSSLPYQKIVYGAPGTGKSHGTEKIISGLYPNRENRDKNVFRTTFHPDSDYSTFVGCYKPTMEEHEVRVVPVVTNNGVSLEQNVGTYRENKIAYKFVPQVFTKAFVRAMQTDEKVFLVIEEINRGNCAQIFGDLFQLLDRDDEGRSSYAIHPDNDLEQYLTEQLGDRYNPDEGMRLPGNLHIWATMNTSDQSLFPIDSAFKRRWDWEYVKITNGRNENGELLGWEIDIPVKHNGEEAERNPLWWDFLKKINEVIADMTSSADKQMGYFFCKATEGKISPGAFVNKVAFYLWNDVFKDFAMDGDALLQYKDEKGRVRDLTFPDFFDEEGKNIDTTRVKDFIAKVLDWTGKETKDEE